MAQDAQVESDTDSSGQSPEDVSALDSDDSGSEVAGCPEPELPPTDVSKASVTFVFSGVGRVVRTGFRCAPVEIKNAAGSRLLVFPEWTRACGGWIPDAEFEVSGPVGAGDVQWQWDGSRLVPFEACVDCDALGFTGRGLRNTVRFAPTAAPAGDYKATFLVVAEDVEDVEIWSVTLGIDPDGDQKDLCPLWQNLEAWTVTVPFDLPESGELIVDVDVSAGAAMGENP